MVVAATAVAAITVTVTVTAAVMIVAVDIIAATIVFTWIHFLMRYAFIRTDLWTFAFALI